jgi:hypothetical protein
LKRDLLHLGLALDLGLDGLSDGLSHSLTLSFHSSALSLLLEQLDLGLLGLGHVLHLLTLHLPTSLLLDLLSLMARVHLLTLRTDLDSQVDTLSKLLTSLLISDLLTLDINRCDDKQVSSESDFLRNKREWVPS